MSILGCSPVMSMMVFMVSKAHVGQVFGWNLNVVLQVKDFQLVQFAEEGGVLLLTRGDGGGDGGRDGVSLKERLHLVFIFVEVVVGVRVVAVCVVIAYFVLFIECHKSIPILDQF